MKKIITALVFCALLLSFSACSKGDTQDVMSTDTASVTDTANDEKSTDESEDVADADISDEGDNDGDDEMIEDAEEVEDDADEDYEDEEDEIDNDGSNTTEKSSGTTKKSSETTKKSSDTTKKSSDTTKKSTDTTKAQTTTKSADTTKASTTTASDTDAPSVVDDGPAPSYPLMSDKVKHKANAEYNNNNTPISSLVEGAGPIGGHGIYVGTHGFMFLGEEIDVYKGVGANLSAAKLRKISSAMNDRDAWAKENGINLYFVIPPAKSTAYADYVPSSVEKASTTKLDNLIAYLNENCTVKVIDLRDCIQNARATYGDKLYYKYDTHWTQDGAFVAYQEIMKQIKKDTPNAVLYGAGDFNITYYETYMKDNLYYLGHYDDFTDEGAVYSLKKGPAATLVKKITETMTGQYVFSYLWPDGYRDGLHYVKFRSKNTDAPNLYMYRDSYSIALIPFLKESFAESTFNWSYDFNKSEILASGAKTVIIECVEKELDGIITKRTFAD